MVLCLPKSRSDLQNCMLCLFVRFNNNSWICRVHFIIFIITSFMELEFGGVHEQLNCDRYIDVDGGLDLWYFYTYPEILWDHLSNNISNNEGSDLRSLCFHNDVCQKVSALEESLLLSQIWKSQWEGEQLEAQELQQDYSKGNRGTNSRVSVSLLNTTECSSSESSRLGSRPNPKPKPKVCWTPELHWLFLKAVEEVGLHNAVPTKILRLMGVSCLTRHHVASHLQKYRSAIKLGKPTKDFCMRRSNKKRSRNCEKIFNKPGLAADSWLMQPSTDKFIHPAKASGTAHYEEGEALQDSAQLFQRLPEDKGGSVSFVDLQAHINSATMCHPARYVE